MYNKTYCGRQENTIATACNVRGTLEVSEGETYTHTPEGTNILDASHM